MREDMAKVIVERPRVGSWLPSRKKGYRKFIQKTAIEDLPRNEPLLGLWRGKGRYLNEHLGPMRRFLRSNVGRPWNKVHQELCEHVCFDNPVQSHVLTHVFDFVHQHVEVNGREVVTTHGSSWSRSYVLPAGAMYICPTSGILKLVRPRAIPLPTHHGLGRLEQYHLRDGVWWELQMRCLGETGLIVRRHAGRRPETCERKLWDVWLERWISQPNEQELIELYGGKLVAISLRPLSRLEARDLNRRQRQLPAARRPPRSC